MAEVNYLTSDDVVALHEDVVRRTGSAPAALVHPALLDSAINRPRHAAYDEGADLVRQGVLLAVGISQSQAFADGNKRAAFQAAVVFWELNGWVYRGDPMELAGWLVSVAEAPRKDRDAEADRFEVWLRGRLMPGDDAGESA